MPGVLIDEMPFVLDASTLEIPIPSAPSSSSYYSASSPSPSPSPRQQQQQQQLLELLASMNSSCPSSPSSTSPEFHRFLPSNTNDESSWSADDVYSCDEFRMFEFKVRRCMRGRSHDWTECPFAHPGEKARRRDPRRFHYSGAACPDFRKGSCKNGDACELAHGVFECWLHPARYRTQPCKDGRSCKRRVCFFAHTPEQLRLLSTSSSSSSSSSGSVAASGAALESSSSPCSSPRARPDCWCSGLQPQYRAGCCGRMMGGAASSPTSTLVSPGGVSPPVSPSASPPMSPLAGGMPRRHYLDSSSSPRRLYSAPASPAATAAAVHRMSELVSALQQLQLEHHKQYSPSPLRPVGVPCGPTRGASLSLPVTPSAGRRWEAMWEMDLGEEELLPGGAEEEAIPVAPRVESGRELRAKIYGRLASASRAEAQLGGCGFENLTPGYGEPSPDLNWVNDLVTE